MMNTFKNLFFVTLLSFGLTTHAQQTVVTVDTTAAKAISPDLVGIFFEDLSYAADGGLYAELVQNRSFEYQPTEQPAWNALMGWDFVKRGGGQGELFVDSSFPIHPNNPNSAMLMVRGAGEGVGLSNAGFDGIVIKAGEKYDFSMFARMISEGLGRGSKTNGKVPISVRLESKDGAVLGESIVEAGGDGTEPAPWKRLVTTITATKSDPEARLVVLAKAPGLLTLDEISLFPRKTFKGRPNGLRADLAQVIADLHPKFMRFPGGCLTHGDGLTNMYRWKDTIGPIEQRRGQPNIWRYHQSVGLGYFEYFQFCEDIGAKPLPVLPAGVTCQNTSHSRGTGQQCLPIADMPAYIQEVLDLIEYANGPATSTWGAKRAAAGHPAPFGLQYLGIGNEDKITPGFEERFKMIFEAVQAKHPEITVIGTVGPAPNGRDFDLGWKFAKELHVPMVDEHYYQAAGWFWANLDRYNNYNRKASKVYLGEWAARDGRTQTNLRAAIAEAGYLTSLERNGDVVHFASYAPLLANRLHTNWQPDLIYFTNTGVFPTISYSVQQLFAMNSGDMYFATTVSPEGKPPDFAASTVRDPRTGDLIVKLVNGASAPKAVHVDLKGTKNFTRRAATKIALAGPNGDVTNEDGKPPAVQPQASPIIVGPTFDYDAPANSLTVIRIKSN